MPQFSLLIQATSTNCQSSHNRPITAFYSPSLLVQVALLGLGYLQWGGRSCSKPTQDTCGQVEILCVHRHTQTHIHSYTTLASTRPTLGGLCLRLIPSCQGAKLYMSLNTETLTAVLCLPTLLL